MSDSENATPLEHRTPRLTSNPDVLLRRAVLVHLAPFVDVRAAAEHLDFVVEAELPRADEATLAVCGHEATYHLGRLVVRGDRLSAHGLIGHHRHRRRDIPGAIAASADGVEATGGGVPARAGAAPWCVVRPHAALLDELASGGDRHARGAACMHTHAGDESVIQHAFLPVRERCELRRER